MPTNTNPPTLADRVIEYIDYLPDSLHTAQTAEIWRVCDQVNQADAYLPEALRALTAALESALENLPDVADDPMFGADATAACCADIAALSHLLAVGDDGKRNIEAYL